MAHANSPDFEHYTRSSIDLSYLDNPTALYDLTVQSSIAALALARHYNGKIVAASAPVVDNPQPTERRAPVIKMVSAGSYKPVKEAEEDDSYTRVCAEQNWVDNGLNPRDSTFGFMAIRRDGIIEPYEGNGNCEDFCLCGPCRARFLPIVGGDFVVVTFAGRSLVPERAMSIKQQVMHYDFGEELEVMATGTDVKGFIVDEVIKKGAGAKLIETLPRFPSRRYRRRKL